MMKSMLAVSSLALLLVTDRAQAADPAAAQGLFDEARTLMSAGRYKEACPKLEESQRLDPAVGTQYQLGSCYEHGGRSASAGGLFLEVAFAAKTSGQAAKEQAAAERGAARDPKLCRVRVV